MQIQSDDLDGRYDAKEFRLKEFFPYQINILANTISDALAQLYRHRFNLTRAEWRVLATLGDKKALTAKDISADTRLEKMQVSRAVARLQTEGLVARRADDRDRRNKILHLTRRGHSLFQKIVPGALAREDYILSALSPGERTALKTIMDKLTDRAGELRLRG